jgi:hypothetical protein
MTHLTLICHAATEATRQTRFPLDEPLTEQGAADAAAAASMIGRNQQAWHGPSARCAQTAAALGLAAQAEPELRDWDIGRWAGHRLTDLHDSEPEAVGRWLTDPTAAPHDGESLAELVARVARWLHGLPTQTGRKATNGRCAAPDAREDRRTLHAAKLCTDGSPADTSAPHGRAHPGSCPPPAGDLLWTPTVSCPAELPDIELAVNTVGRAGGRSTGDTVSGSALSARATARLVAVCAVLAGLFFMHGLPAQERRRPRGVRTVDGAPGNGGHFGGCTRHGGRCHGRVGASPAAAPRG